MSTDLQTTQKPANALGQFLSQSNVRRQLQMALPKHMTVDRMVRVALTAAIKTPKLYQCTFESVAACLLNAAQLGLEPNGRDAHLIPFENKKARTVECTLIPDYKGLIQLAYRSGMLDNLTAKAVYEKDIFEYEFGTDEHLKHVPCTEDDPGELIYAWAMVRFKDGGSKFVVLNRRDISKRKAKSQTASSNNEWIREQSPWNQYPEAMWAKSAVKELSKWIPQTPELQSFHKAVELDTSADLGAPIIDTTSQNVPEEPPPASKSDALAEELASRQQTQETTQQAHTSILPPRPAKQAQQEPSTPPANKEGQGAAPAGELTQDEKDDINSWREILDEYMTIGEVQSAENTINPKCSPALKAKLHEICEERKTAIRNNRGERS